MGKLKPIRTHSTPLFLTLMRLTITFQPDKTNVQIYLKTLPLLILLVLIIVLGKPKINLIFFIFVAWSSHDPEADVVFVTFSGN